MNFCDFAGHVVNGIPLPTDPIDHDVERLPIRGCTRLCCGQCGAMVRTVSGLVFRGPTAQVDLESFYALSNLAASSLLVPRAGGRVYICRCSSWFEAIGWRALAGPDPDPSYDPQVPWRCAGHPVTRLPHAFDQVEVTPENVGDVVERALRGDVPSSAHPEDRHGGLWTARLYTRLAKTPWQAAVAAAALAAMSDTDPKVRSRSVHALFVLKLPEGATRAVELLDGDRVGFAGVADMFSQVRNDQTLEHSLWRLADPLVAQAGRARELARADSLTPGKGHAALYGALAAGDPEWLAARLKDVARANPEQVNALSSAVRNRSRAPRAPTQC